MKTSLIIAGSDSGGGAGIQADIKTMTANGVYAMTAITALTAQNTMGVAAICEASPEFLGQQLDAVFTDIFPDSVKIGMISNPALIEITADRLKKYNALNIVADPVMVATSGADLSSYASVEAMKKLLFPIAKLITPNIPEAQMLTGMIISTEKDMENAARELYEKYGCNVLLKGGHSVNDANDFLYSEAVGRWFYGRRINNSNTHGTGCTLSSAIASNLAKGFDIYESVSRAKEYISGALSAMLDLGKGRGPMKHGFDIKSRFTEGK